MNPKKLLRLLPRIDGAEFNYMQPLKAIAALGEWGKYFNFSASGSMLHLQGANGADFNRFIPKSSSMGLTFSRRAVILMAKYNYRGRQGNSAKPAPPPTPSNTTTPATTSISTPNTASANASPSSPTRATSSTRRRTSSATAPRSPATRSPTAARSSACSSPSL